jgi:hypothetical protein
VNLYSRVSGRCAPADVEPVVLVSPLYLDRTGSLPRAQMAAFGAEQSKMGRATDAWRCPHNGPSTSALGIQHALEAGGIEFTANANGGLGVRLRRRP